MVRITAEDDLWMKDLARLVEPVEISDLNGTLLGVFVPADRERKKRLSTEAAARIDHAELERRKASERGKGRTTREVFEYLLTLASDPADQEHLRKVIAEVAERDRCSTP
jgi:hypothetical protein